MTADVITTDDDEEGEVEGLVKTNGHSSQPSQPMPKPRPRPAYRGHQPSGNGIDEAASRHAETTDEEHSMGPLSPIPMERNGRDGSPLSSLSPPPQISVEVTGLNNSPLKPSKHVSDVEMEYAVENVTSDIHPEKDGTSFDATLSEEIVLRRKRVRH